MTRRRPGVTPLRAPQAARSAVARQAAAPQLAAPVAMPLASIPMMVPDLWMMIVVQLPEKFEYADYTVSEIAPLLNLTAAGLRFYCRELWPAWEGHYRFCWSEAVYLIYRACRDARSVVRRDLYLQLREAGIIAPGFPDTCPTIERAVQAVRCEREQFAKRRAADPTQIERRSEGRSGATSLN